MKDEQVYEVVHEVRGYVVERVSATSPEEAVGKAGTGVSDVMGHSFLGKKTSKLVRVEPTNHKPAKSWASRLGLFNDVPELKEDEKNA